MSIGCEHNNGVETVRSNRSRQEVNLVQPFPGMHQRTFGVLAAWVFLPIFFCHLSESALIRRSPAVFFYKAHRNTRNAIGGAGPVTKSHLSLRNTPPSSLTVHVHDSKVLECEAGGNPPPTIHWLKNGHRIPQNTPSAVSSNLAEDGNQDLNPVLGLSFTRSRLYLDCITPRDEGVYTCVAENAYHRVSSDSAVNIAVRRSGERSANCLKKKSAGGPARIHMWTHTRLELMGSAVQLFCRATGVPQPQVMWFGPDDSSLDAGDKYQILDNGDLVIQDISWDDMGGYTCVSENSHGSDRTLTFLYPTRPEKRN